MRATAKAFETQIMRLRSEVCHSEAERNNRGTRKKYNVGDQVSFFIPPSEKQAKQMGRKPKHMPQYRGPAIIVKVLTNTTHELMYQGRAYFRCFGEIRPHKSNKLPMNLSVHLSTSVTLNLSYNNHNLDSDQRCCAFRNRRGCDTGPTSHFAVKSSLLNRLNVVPAYLPFVTSRDTSPKSTEVRSSLIAI